MCIRCSLSAYLSLPCSSWSRRYSTAKGDTSSQLLFRLVQPSCLARTFGVCVRAGQKRR